MFNEPPIDVKKQGCVWKLRKPLYGLDGASQKFWLFVKDVFLNELGLKIIHGDEAFYYSNVDGKIQGAILTHVDDLYCRYFRLCTTNNRACRERTYYMCVRYSCLYSDILSLQD